MLNLRIFRSVCDGQLAFGKALVLATQLQYQSHLPSATGLGSRKLMSLHKRLARVEQAVADIAKRKEEAATTCICTGSTWANSCYPEEFEAEMNRVCPVHEFRALGRIFVARFSMSFNGWFDETARQAERDPKELERLLEIYRARHRSWLSARSAHLNQVGLEIQNDPKER